MSLISRIHQEQNELHTIAEGTITIADVRAHLLKEQKNSELPYRELIDGRKAVVQLSPADVREIVKLLSTLSQESKLGPTAVVVYTDVAYGMMRMLQILVEDVCIVEPFRELRQAQQWLRDLPPTISQGTGE